MAVAQALWPEAGPPRTRRTAQQPGIVVQLVAILNFEPKKNLDQQRERQESSNSVSNVRA